MASQQSTVPARQAPQAEREGDSEEAVSNDIPFALKYELVDGRGVGYRDFRRTLEPRWRRVWRDVGAAYLAMAAVLAALLAWAPGLPWAIPAAIGGALVIGYAIQFLGNFFHEAAHYNLVPGRRRNDRVTNLLMGWLFASSIAAYRRTHLQHHRALGTTVDSEISYFDPLRVRYLVEGLTGVRALRSVTRWRASSKRLDRARRPEPASSDSSRLGWIVLGAVVNAGLAAALVAAGSAAAAAAWLGGLLVVFPFLASLRQLLEHRSEQADASVDYTEVDHGPVNRIFGEGPLASTLGSAGFNRHALHHWEPTVSYTRLRDIEEFLLRTDAAPLVRERQTTYRDTFLRLLEL